MCDCVIATTSLTPLQFITCKSKSPSQIVLCEWALKIVSKASSCSNVGFTEEFFVSGQNKQTIKTSF